MDKGVHSRAGEGKPCSRYERGGLYAGNRRYRARNRDIGSQQVPDVQRDVVNTQRRPAKVGAGVWSRGEEEGAVCVGGEQMKEGGGTPVNGDCDFVAHVQHALLL